jgi:D-alanyl-D-alanine carboxypeptidase
MRMIMMVVLPIALWIGPSSAVIAAKTPDAAAIKDYAEQLLEQNYQADGPGAVVLVARGDEVLYRGARGLASVELGVPLAPDQVFRIGSVTKQFAAATVMKLIDQGKLSLDAPLSKFVPDYPNGDKITVLQLLNHTSGVKSYTGIPGVMDGPIRKDLSTSALIDSFKDLPVDFAPGSSWAYNNSGYVLLGAVIEAVSGSTWDAAIREQLLTPVGLSHTQFGADDVLIARMASGYGSKSGQVIPAAYLSMTQPHAAGALVSTLDDLHRWNRALHGGQLLTPASYQQMVTPTDSAREANYGFGIGAGTVRGRPQFSHGGGIPGFASHLLYLPKEQISVAVLQNSDDGADAAVTAVKLAAFALGDPYPEAKAIAVDAEELAAYEGVYRIDENATRTLRIVDGELTSQRTGGQRLKLIPIEADLFLFEEGLTQLRIERNDDKQISGMRLLLNGEGEGQPAERTDEPLPSERAHFDLDATQMQRILGAYLAGPGTMTVFVEGDQLKVQLSGQPAFDLYAETPDRFFLTVVDATLDFAAGEPAPSLTLNQGGGMIEFTRKVE